MGRNSDELCLNSHMCSFSFFEGVVRMHEL